jgi:hypothetical protein
VQAVMSILVTAFLYILKNGGVCLLTSVAEPELEPHHLVGAGAVKRCGSGSDGSDSDDGIHYG